MADVNSDVRISLKPPRFSGIKSEWEYYKIAMRAYLSVSGLGDALIAWKSKAQSLTALSSSEAEFYACAEAVKEIPFIAQTLLSMGISVELPVNVWIDNVGAIFMSENQTTSPRTRHMDCRWWFVSDLREQGLIKIQFVRTKENLSDIGTKNVDKETYDRLTGHLLMQRGEEGC